MSRRSARSQPLDPQAALWLNSLTPPERNAYARALFSAGWTLQSIADATTPPISRQSVKKWVDSATAALTHIDVPIPTYKTPEGGYVPVKPPSPGISLKEASLLRQLSENARQFRSGMASTSLYAVANDDFNAIVRELYYDNVTITEIAKASGVTYRAIARRLGK